MTVTVFFDRDYEQGEEEPALIMDGGIAAKSEEQNIEEVHSELSDKTR